MLCDAMLCDTILYDAMRRFAMPCDVSYALRCFLCHALRRYAMLCYAMLYDAMLCYAILCYAMLCHAIENRSEIDPKTVQHRSKIGPKSASEPTSLPTSILDRFGTVFGPFWARSWRPLSGLSGVKLGSSWSKNRFLEVLDGVQKRTWCWIPFWTDFWSVLGRFWDAKSSQNRSRIDLKSDDDIKTRILVLTHKNQWFLHIFVHRWIRNSLKNQSDSFLKAVLSWEAKTTPKNGP